MMNARKKKPVNHVYCWELPLFKILVFLLEQKNITFISVPFNYDLWDVKDN